MAAKVGILTCHFNWNMEPDNTKDPDNVIDKINIHIKDEKDNMMIPALLFRAYLYMSAYSQPSKNPGEAVNSLDDAKKEIEKLDDDDAKVGFNIVYNSLAAIILGEKRYDEEKEKLYRKKVQELERNLTPMASAYIDATRAFALSRLGPSRVEDCLKYFEKALDVSRHKVEWLLYFGVVYGRYARITEGTLLKDTDYTRRECRIYEKALRLEPANAMAYLYLGEVLFREGNQSLSPKYFAKALQFAPCNMTVLNWSARYYRKTYFWTKALECVNKVLELTYAEPDPMVYHQKALIYLRKYQGLLYKKRQKDPRTLPGENRNSSDSLLFVALKAINKAITLNNRALSFGLCRAKVCEYLRDVKGTEDEYSRLLTHISDGKPHDNIDIFLNFGHSMFRMGKQPKAMSLLRRGIEMAVKDCTEVVQDGRRRFYGSDERYVKDAIHTYETFFIAKDDHAALKNMGWLVYSVSNMVKQYTQTHKPALYFYREAYDKVQNADPGDESTDEILIGLINCHITEGREDDFSKAEEYVGELKDAERQRVKMADLKLAKGKRQVTLGNHQEARRTFLEAAEVGSLEACEVLVKSLVSSQRSTWGWHDVTTWKFREDCAKVIHCITSKDDILTISQTMGALSLHGCNNDGVQVAKENLTRRIKQEMELSDPMFGEIRTAHFDLERAVLAQPTEQDLIKQCVDVMSLARNKLDHVVQEFGSKNYPSVQPKDRRQWKYPYIRRGVANNVEKALTDILEGQAKWKNSQTKTGFNKDYPELFKFLVQVQPATDPAYDWISALANLVNTHKHQGILKELDPEADIGKNPDGTQIKQKFNLINLARVASEGVEPICRKFYEFM